MRILSSMIVLATLTAASPPRRCNVPVFRYALERWPAELYEVFVFHRGPLGEGHQAAVDEMRKSDANLAVAKVDVAEPMEREYEQVWKSQKDPSLPWMVVRYPACPPEVPPAWAGPLGAEGARLLVDSPARREIGKRILSGESAVWLLLEGGDRAKDDAAADLMKAQLARLEKTLKLPPPAVDDPPMRSELPLKVAFSVLRISRADPAERGFVSMLMNSVPHLAQVAQPIAFPIFGRGRVLQPLAGEEFVPSFFEAVGSFLVGACSCEAKQLNPGLDLLVAVDWEKGLSLGPPPKTEEIPMPVLKPRVAPPEPDPPEPVSPRGFPREVLWAGTLLAAALVVITGRRLMRSAGRRAA